MPRKQRNPKIRINTEITETESQWFLDEGWGALAPVPSEERLQELRTAYGDELLERYQEKYGLFCRPDYWWENVAPEQCRRINEDHIETQKSYFLRHPELQTAEEREWLKTHQFSKWELMPASEMADLEYCQAHPSLLEDDEFEAMQQYAKSTGPE